MRALPPLNALPAFEATARLGSMVLAAQELGRTHGAISKQIRALSEAIGCPLFEKDGTGIKLTREGARLLEEVSGALDRLSNIHVELSRSAQKAVVTVSISSTFASRWLMPRLPRFYAKHPEISLDFKMGGQFRQTMSDADVHVTWDRLRGWLGPNDTYKPFADVSFGLVHSPAFQMPEMSEHIHVAARLVSSNNLKAWDAWGKLAGKRVSADHDIQMPQTNLIIEGAVNGIGIAVLERRLIEEELQDERLVAPLGFQTVTDGFGAFLFEGSKDKPAVRAFCDWLTEALQ